MTYLMSGPLLPRAVCHNLLLVVEEKNKKLHLGFGSSSVSSIASVAGRVVTGLISCSVGVYLYCSARAQCLCVLFVSFSLCYLRLYWIITFWILRTLLTKNFDLIQG